MVDNQQGNPKRYQVEFAVDAALMEDALNGNLGQATTDFLSAIGLINNKENPVESTGDNTKISKEPKTDNKNDKVKNITKNATPKKSTYDCNQNGRIYKNKELGTINLVSDNKESSDNSSVQTTNKQNRRLRAQQHIPKNLQ